MIFSCCVPTAFSSHQATELSSEHPVVISKFILNAKEIEMDAVAKDGASESPVSLPVHPHLQDDSTCAGKIRRAGRGGKRAWKPFAFARVKPLQFQEVEVASGVGYLL